MDRLEVKISITKLLLGLLIVIVPLSIIGLILTENSDRSLDNVVGNDFKTMAQVYSNDVSQFVTERVSDVKLLASDQTVVSAVAGTKRTTANARNKGAEPQNTIPNSDKSGESGNGAVQAQLNSPASQLLRQQKDLDPRFLWLFATDANGNVLAASQRPGTPSYAHDEFWQSTFSGKSRAATISDILYNGPTKSYFINIGVPILDPVSNQPVGVLGAAVNMTQLLATFQSPTSNGARIELVNDDGVIVSGPNSDVFAHVKSGEFAAVRDSLGSLQGRQSGWEYASLSQGPYLVGFAGTGLKQTYDKLGWFVLVSQDEHQALAPITGLGHFALIMVILACFMLVLLCVYYFLHRSQRFEDIEQAFPESRSAAASM